MTKGWSSHSPHRLHLGLLQTEQGRQLGVTGAAIGHYETGVSKPSPDRAAQLARLLGLELIEVSASKRGSANQAASRFSKTEISSQDEGAVLYALRAVPAAERRIMMKLVLVYEGNASRAAAARCR